MPRQASAFELAEIAIFAATSLRQPLLAITNRCAIAASLRYYAFSLRCLRASAAGAFDICYLLLRCHAIVADIYYLPLAMPAYAIAVTRCHYAIAFSLIDY